MRSPAHPSFALFAVLAVAAACSSGDKPSDAIPIGTFLPLTGEMAPNGGPQSIGVAVAVDDVNAAGGVLGKKLRVVNTDDGTDPAKAKSAAQSLIDQKVHVAIGSSGSDLTLAAAEVLTPARVVMISPGSTSPAITTFADDGYMFRTCPSDLFQGRLLAQRASSRGLTAAVVLHHPNAYGAGLADAFASTFTGLGGSVLLKEAYTPEQSDYEPLLARAFGGATLPDVVLLAGYATDGAKIVQKYATAHFGAAPVSWLFTDGVASPSFVEAVGRTNFPFPHEGTTFASPTGPRWEAFARSYEAKAKAVAVAGDGAAQAYDAAIVAALAMVRAGSTEGPAVRDALRTLKGATTYGPDRLKEALAAAAAGTAFTYSGVSGPIEFDDSGDIMAASYDLWKVASGSYTVFDRNVAPAR